MKIKKIITLVLTILMLTSLLAGCGANQPADTSAKEAEEKPATRIVKHLMGETEIPAEPKRVIDLVGLLDNMIALDLEVIAAPSAKSWAGFDFAPYELERHKGEIVPIEDGWSPSLELLMSLEPDLIIGYEGMEDKYEELSKIAPTVFLSHEWGNLREGLRELGVIFDREEKAEEVIKEYDEIVDEAKTKLQAVVGDDEEAMFLRISDKFYRVYNNYGQVGRLLYDDLGFKLMKDYPIEEWKQDLSMEGLFVYNPDRIFLMTNSGAEPEKLLNELEKSNIWKDLKAVKNDRLYNANDFIYYAQGPIGSRILIEQILQNIVK